MKKWDAKFYDTYSIMQCRTAFEMLNDFNLNGDVLDIGCGSGKITAAIAEKIPKGNVYGLDISENMIQYAKKNYVSNNLCFVVGDVTDMDYQNKFDIVVSFWTLSWVQDQKKALENIIKSLKSTGKMLLMYPLRHDVYEIIEGIIKKPQWQEYFQNCTQPRPFINEDKYHLLLEDIGIDRSFISKKQLSCEFETREEMKHSIRSWLSYLDKIEDENEKKFIFGRYR